MTDPAASGLLDIAHPPRTIDGATSIAEAAQTMGLAHVGSLVVTEDGRPVGLLTDRDVAMAALLRSKGSALPTAGEVASRPFLYVARGASLAEVTQLMERECVRRLGVVDEDGSLVGVVAADEILMALGRSLAGLAGTVAREFSEEIDPTTSGRSPFGQE